MSDEKQHIEGRMGARLEGSDAVFTPEALASFARQAVGKPVTLNFQGPPIGRVVDAHVDDRGLAFSMEIEAGHGIVPPTGFSIQPGFVPRRSENQARRSIIEAADLHELSIVDEPRGETT